MPRKAVDAVREIDGGAEADAFPRECGAQFYPRRPRRRARGRRGHRPSGGPGWATVRVTLEIEAEVPEGVPERVVRTVTENGRRLKFTRQGFERE